MRLQQTTALLQGLGVHAMMHHGALNFSCFHATTYACWAASRHLLYAVVCIAYNHQVSMQLFAGAHPAVGAGSPLTLSTHLLQHQHITYQSCSSIKRIRRRAEQSQLVALAATSPPPSTAPARKPLVQECSVHDWRSPLRCDATPQESDRDIVVALGKFDAMHLGHQSLAIKAAENGCQPVLLSFSGMAQVLGWPEKLPLVAAPDRPRVLASWTNACTGRIPRQRLVPFHEIRRMSPEEFVVVLAQQLGAAGVVAGSNYRFGYKAAGDARALQELGAKYGMRVHIVDLIPEASVCPQSEHGQINGNGLQPALAQQISSSKVRELLSVGNVQAVQRLLGRRYRLVARSPQTCDTESPQGSHVVQGHDPEHKHEVGADFVPVSCFLNHPPAPGLYAVHAAWVAMPSWPGGPGQLPQSSALPQPLSVPMQVLASAIPSNGHSEAGCVAHEQHVSQLVQGQQHRASNDGEVWQGLLPACSSVDSSTMLLPAEGQPHEHGADASPPTVLRACHCRVTPQGVQLLDMPAECKQVAGHSQACLVIDFEHCISTA